ncbi:tRNA uridine-5-carboxymethylaminomethyl(34) synthesis GTPase MnmE [bacterium]|nr:tRNA uridine-5-carboxymethylaminomethyl(34) synthesis GTPase MnmE [bacterium]
MEDTIVAISTALGIGAISIIRVSGKDSIKIVNKIFSGCDLTKVDSHTIHYGKIKDQDEVIDEVLVTIMKNPKTFTCEDVVEVNCHGGITTTQKVLELLILNGCRLAEPGEFSKRAFLNGRIDLQEAEGIMDLIEAKTEEQRKIAINKVEGKVSNLIRNIREKLVELLSNIAVNIDYPEYEDIEIVTSEKIKKTITEVRENLFNIIKESENGQFLQNGIKTVIIGKPNVGKSSLLNNLLEEDKAIVTDIAGTTRDIVEGTINLDGILLNIIDTAGIRKTDNVVEKIGVEKSIQLIDAADLILFVLNNNEKIDNEELDLLNRIKNKNHILIINKIDLPTKIDKNQLYSEFIIQMSNLEKKGIDELKSTIKKIFNLEKISTSDFTYITSSKDIAILKKALKGIVDIENGLDQNLPIDMLEIDIKDIWNSLGEITGDTYDDELVDNIFKHFCLGK